MKKCRHCGAPIEDMCDTICAYCGNPLGKGRSTEEPYSHQEYTQQHTSQQYAQHTSQQRVQTQYEQRYERQEQHLPSTINPYDTKRTEAQGRTSVAKFLAILSIPFCYVFVISIIALAVSSSVLQDKYADDAAIKSAKSARTIAIISLFLGIIFMFGQSVLINIMP